MSCCGNKRNQWKREIELPITSSNTVNAIEKQESKLFEYTGFYPFSIKGVSSGKTYSFRFKGDKQSVDFSDSFSLMAEPDLIVVKS